MNKRTIVIFLFIFFGAFSFAQQRDSIVRVGACSTPGTALGISVQGQYAYVADVGLTSVDINVPFLPVVLDYLNDGGCLASGIFIRDTLVYINSSFSGPAFSIASIANPSSLYRISYIIVPDGGLDPKGIICIDTLVYFADGLAGFLIINTSDLLSPSILCTLDTPGECYDLHVRDTLAFLADRDSLLIVNVSNPYNPIIIGHTGIPGAGAYDIWISGNYAFVTEMDVGGGQGKVNMIDISDPTTPFLVEQINMAATPYGLFVVDDKIYVAADDWWKPPKIRGEGRADIEGGIRVIQWEEPDSMSLLVSFDTPGRCRDIFVVDSFMYIAAWDSFMIYKYASTGIAESNQELTLLRPLTIYSNPFSDQTEISFAIPTRAFVSLEIFDALGRRIRDLVGGYFTPGQYEVTWNGKDSSELKVASGVYYIKLSIKSGSTRSERKRKVMYIK